MKTLFLFIFFPAVLFSQFNPVFISKANLSYPKVQASNESMFGFEQGGKIGYLDKNANVVIPAIYSYDSATSSQSIPYFYKGYVKVVKNKKCGLIDKTGKEIIPIEYENITPYTQFGNFVLVTKTIAGKKNYGVLTIQNKELVPIEFEDIKFDTNMLSVKQNGKWGLINKAGKQLLPCEYNYLNYSATDKVLIATKGSQYGVIDINGQWLFEKSASVFTLVSCKFGMLLCKVNNKYGYLDLKGNEVIITQYDFAYDFENNGLAKVHNKVPGNYTNLYGYIDKKGNEIIPVKHEIIGSFINGLVYVKDPSSNRYGYMEKTGKWILKPVYLEATSFDESGGAWVKTTDNKYQYINKAGKELGTLNDKGEYRAFGMDGYTVIENTEYPYVVIDKTGKQIKKIDDCDGIYLFSEGIAGYKSKANSKYGFVDTEGNKIIPNEYDGFAGFSEGIAKVDKKVDGKNKSGYIDAKGNIILPLVYETVGTFRDGWGLIKKDSNYFFVDRNGNLKEPPRKYNELYDFKSGFSLGVIKAKNNNLATYYYINKQLKEEFSTSFKESYAIWDDVAVIKRDKEYELMNKKGEVFKSLGAVDYLRFSVEGMISVRQNRKWGFVNNRGDIIVTPKYDSCEVFKYGYAKVKMGNKWGIIDKSGTEIIEPKYENILPGENGLFIFFDKFWGIIDKTGKILVAPNYLIINSFEKDRTIARFGKSYTILKSPLVK